MKKLLLTIATAAVMLAGCNADVDIRPINTQKLADFYGEISAETRTQLVDNQSDNTSYAAWVDGEFISIFYLSNPNNQYKVCDITNEGKNARFTATGVFTDVTDADYKDFSKHYAMYPYSENNKMLEEGVITTILPATQTYNPESNLAYVPMVASSENTSLSFVIPTSLMRISVSRNNPLRSTLKQIILSSEGANIPLAGEIEFDMNGANVVTTVKGTENAIVLDLGEGVAITTEQVDYYISLPPVTFPAKNAMTVTLVYTQGNTTKQFVKTWSDKDLVFNAGDRKGTSIVLSLEDFNGSTAYPATGGELVGNLTLTTDMNITQPLTVPAGEEATLNLNGHNITNKEENTATDVIIVEEGATLTINGNGNVTAVSGNDGYPIVCYGELIINDGVFTSGIDAAGATNACIYAKTNGKITINGGEFKSADGSFVLNLHDGSRSTASITVKGGKFYGFDPANNASEGAGTNFVAEGYISVETSENVWEVFPANEPVEVATAAALEDVLAQGGKATLTADIAIEKSLVVADDKSATLDLNGKNITVNTDSVELGEGDAIIVYGDLTINGEGTVKGNTRAVWARSNTGATVTINGGTYVGSTKAACEVIYASGNGQIVIKDGDFSATNINDGDFAAPQYAVLNLHGNGKDGANITVYGGTFHNFDPANNISENPVKNFVAEGYISVETKENVWEVFPANEPVEVATAAALEDVLAQGGKATLTADIAIEKSLVVADDKSATLDLNGKNITVNTDSVELGEGDAIIVYGDLTINGEGTVKGNTRAVWARSNTGATVTINGGTYVGSTKAACEVIYASGNGQIVIKDGDFSATNINEGDFAAPQYAVLNLHGNGKDGANITVYGGTFHNFDPANNISENPVKNFVAEGYISVETKENVWEVFLATKPVEVATAAALEDVLAQGGKATLTTDIAIEKSLVVADGKSATLDLNGNDITVNTDSVELGEGDAIIVYGDLTINGEGTVTGNTRAVWARSDTGATVTINGGTYVGSTKEACEVIYASGNGQIVINGGDFSATNINEGDFAAPQYAVLNLHGNGKDGANITVYGGTFHNFDPANNISENPVKNFVAEGYISVETKENVWEVFLATKPVEVATAAALEDVLAQGGKATLTANIVLEKSLNVTKDSTLNLNGKNITCDKSDVLVVTNGTLTINGDGVVYASSDNSSSASAVWAKENGNVVINGGTFKVGDDESSKASGNWRNDCIYARDNATITINGGKFQYTGINEEGHKFLLNLRDANNTTASIVVNGGEFYKFDPANNSAEGVGTNFVAEGKTSTANGDWYIVK